MKLEPIGDKVFIKVDEQQKSTPSGILLPQDEDYIPTSGVAVAVGPGAQNEEGRFFRTVTKPGDRVYFNKRLGKTLEIDNETYCVLKESEDILAIERG